ncbi:hypothetical protein TTHERM_000266659 (macronuclear) [Tetrahymena thermophila SB210]|uniref:Uncharacterized protein n=1 Tax=Tetrahymena thermophila (strain SB210) TaxID=312017 RepID=W7X4X3_TETTS|nr:hypothetical protein TTHERM_000266659 [Tetrahymena thermophila SB210]EWS74380.1 hypothetical protein TTHERM_000266659 [Tetrahymena thermophila SB210]|eukprot:XP_012653057.1 hypothetical protein TTHERM_000266659 [Tetrahymena thermophila SB210]
MNLIEVGHPIMKLNEDFIFIQKKSHLVEPKYIQDHISSASFQPQFCYNIVAHFKHTNNDFYVILYKKGGSGKERSRALQRDSKTKREREEIQTSFQKQQFQILMNFNNFKQFQNARCVM